MPSDLVRLCIIYRGTQKKSNTIYEQTKISLFLEQFGDYLDTLLQKVGKPVICGDFNIHVEDKLDLVAQRFLALIKSKGFQQHK